MKQSETRRPDARWQSDDGRLIVCHECGERLWIRFDRDKWFEMPAEYLNAYVESTHHALPCDLCSMTQEAEEAGYGLDSPSLLRDEKMDEYPITGAVDNDSLRGTPLDI